MLPLYRAWFRVTSRKIRNLPAKGPAIVVPNHGGYLPFDGAMLWTDIVLQSEPGRVPRFVMDNFVLNIPVVGTAFARTGDPNVRPESRLTARETSGAPLAADDEVEAFWKRRGLA